VGAQIQILHAIAILPACDGVCSETLKPGPSSLQAQNMVVELKFGVVG